MDGLRTKQGHVSNLHVLTGVQFRTSIGLHRRRLPLPLVYRYVKNKWSISTGAGINDVYNAPFCRV